MSLNLKRFLQCQKQQFVLRVQPLKGNLYLRLQDELGTLYDDNL